jgi:hypothetical protein
MPDVGGNPYASAGKRILRAMREPTPSTFTLWRNSALGAAAVCIAILVQMLQLPVLDTALLVSIFCCAVGIPCLVSSAMLFEIYIVIGDAAYRHARTGRRLSEVPYTIGGIASVGALFFSIYHLSPAAAYAFLAVSLFCYLYLSLFALAVGTWLPKDEKSGGS